MAGLLFFKQSRQPAVIRQIIKGLTGFILMDGNYHELYRERIEWTNFPLKRIELWFENGVLILPSE
ncbi:MAG: hypothetical protein QME65_02330 [Candidatus Omnitrophota bacterium]|nr:hypothetical protein [Candidatus Omnitrophota bacterium]